MRNFLLVAVLIQLPMALITGYYSHDELQWLEWADTDSLIQVPWISWLDLTIFQYRPLTFNFWLLTSHYWGYHPIVMHSIQALLGVLNACLLRQSLREFQVADRVASAAALAFLLIPFVAFSHSWIGTFADQFYLGLVLFAVIAICRGTDPVRRGWQRFVTPARVAGLTLLALSSKESAVVFPCLLLCTLYRVPWRRLLPSIIISALIVAIYLALRLETILFAPRPPGIYAWAIGNIPLRLVEYSLFPFLYKWHDIGAFPWTQPGMLIIAGCGLLALLAAMASAGKRWLLALLLVWSIALGPILILSSASDLYPYGASAFVCGLVALAYPQFKPWGKGLLGIAMLMMTLHSVELVRHMRQIGAMQHRLYVSMLPLLSSSQENALRIRAARAEDFPILTRLTFKIARYRRQIFSPRIQIIDQDQAADQADYVMLHNGAVITSPRATEP